MKMKKLSLLVALLMLFSFVLVACDTGTNNNDLGVTNGTNLGTDTDLGDTDLGDTDLGDTGTGGIDDQSGDVFVDPFISDLEADGISVSTADFLEEPLWLDADHRSYDVNGDQVDVYQFESDAEAADALGAITPDIDPAGGTPHYFLSGNTIVVYWGDNNDTLTSFNTSLGTEMTPGVTP